METNAPNGKKDWIAVLEKKWWLTIGLPLLLCIIVTLVWDVAFEDLVKGVAGAMAIFSLIEYYGGKKGPITGMAGLVICILIVVYEKTRKDTLQENNWVVLHDAYARAAGPYSGNDRLLSGTTDSLRLREWLTHASWDDKTPLTRREQNDVFPKLWDMRQKPSPVPVEPPQPDILKEKQELTAAINRCLASRDQHYITKLWESFPISPDAEVQLWRAGEPQGKVIEGGLDALLKSAHMWEIRQVEVSGMEKTQQGNIQEISLNCSICR